MAVTTVAREYHKAFCVDATFFERVAKLVYDSAGVLQVKISLSDSSIIEDISIADLIAFPNLSSRRIERVDLETPRAAATRMKLTMRCEDFAAPASYQIVGNDKDASYLSIELDKLLRDAFVWYSPLSTLSTGLFLICLFAIFGGLLTTLAGMFGIANSAGAIILQSNSYVAIAAAIIVIVFVFYLFIRKRWFPAGTFRIGDGVIRANKSASLRHAIFSILFGGVLLGLLVHLFGSRIYDSFFRP